MKYFYIQDRCYPVIIKDSNEYENSIFFILFINNYVIIAQDRLIARMILILLSIVSSFENNVKHIYMNKKVTCRYSYQIGTKY